VRTKSELIHILKISLKGNLRFTGSGTEIMKETLGISIQITTPTISQVNIHLSLRIRRGIVGGMKMCMECSTIGHKTPMEM
jgi:hypothetical protein